MSMNARALLAAYLQYQRDIGVDALVFGRGSAVKTLLGGAARAANKIDAGNSHAAPPTSSTASRTAAPPAFKGAAGGYGARPAAGVAASGASASPLSKLSKLRPIDTLDVRKFERPAPPPPANSPKREKLAALYREALNCERCGLSKNRAKVIFGSGSADGRFFVIGGAPDSCDEVSGLPFQGEAGELLDKILSKMGLDRKKDIFATYVQKCGRCGTQEDLPQYAAECRALLDSQIEIIQPKVILIFGCRPANFILENGEDIEQLRAMYHIYKEVPVVATYGLSLMLKETQYRSGAWEDIKKAMNYAG